MQVFTFQPQRARAAFTHDFVPLNCTRSEKWTFIHLERIILPRNRKFYTYTGYRSENNFVGP